MRRSIYILLLVLCSCVAHAQIDTEMRDIYTQAESDYQIGRIEQARDTLLQNLSSFHDNLRQNALRLVALCYLARFDMEKTEYYTSQMLQENPYYSPSSGDPATFADIVNNIKAGMTATITTASSQAESLAEVPVPATLITAEMIQNSGARNLQEVLTAFVPGMSIIDCDDDINIAMRGIYNNTQEKILIMLNGHRLNSYATNTAAPDFSISLEKVKQIEVLRGPASSLYGGVALTAVVNIITKQGGDVDGLNAKAAAGNHGQIKADVLFGKRYFDVDLLVWGGLYRNSGEKYDVTNERTNESSFTMPVDQIRIGRIGERPSYDFGIQLGFKGLQFMYDSHFSQVIAPFTITPLALSFDHDKYRTFNGLSPSFSVNSHHADLSYQWNMLHIDWKAAATYDKADLTRYQVINDEPIPNLVSLIFLPANNVETFSTNGGIFRYVNGQEQDYGFQLKGNHAYTIGNNHKGNITFGVEFNHFQLDDIRYQIGYNFVQTFEEDPRIRNAGNGQENGGNAYLQLKHQWDISLFSRRFSVISNVGLRFDHKVRYDDTMVNELSPRLALILLRPKWNVKMSYSKSFVDAPFIYRKANLISSILDDDNEMVIKLSPERVHSFQLSFAGTNWVKGLNCEINGFYNRAEDLIQTTLTYYKNDARNKTCGVELMASYKQSKLTANWNLTWTHTFKSNLINLLELGLSKEFTDQYSSAIDANNNTPTVMSNLVLGWQATPRLKLHTHVLFESKQTSYNTNIEKLVTTIAGALLAMDYANMGMLQEYEKAWQQALDDASELVMRKEMPARAILNIGGEYAFGPITIGLNVHNVLGTRYHRSGMNTNIIPQQGRWFLGSLAIQL